MMVILLLTLGSVALLLLWFFLFPVKYIRGLKREEHLIEPPNAYITSLVIHIHTQFSYDSLGKPEDIAKARDDESIDYALITDHDTDIVRLHIDERTLAGREVKLNDDKGLVGDLIEIGNVKVIAHHFREKYRWKLDRDPEYLIELIDLRDALLDSKIRLILYLIASLFLYPVLGMRLVDNFRKLIKVDKYVKQYMEEGWKNKVVGGLDHHVKLYINEVKNKILVPHYRLSFRLMRNFLMSDKKIESGEDLLEEMKRGSNLISFSPKPSYVWKEGKEVKVLTPYANTILKVVSSNGRESYHLSQSLLLSDLSPGYYMILGYTYSLKVGGLFLGLKPLFVSDLLEVN